MLGDEEWEGDALVHDYLPVIKDLQKGISVINIWSQIPFQSYFFSLLMSGNTSPENTRNQKRKTGFTPFLQTDCWL